MSKYNPWEEQNIFIQDVGGLKNLLNFANNENIIISDSMPIKNDNWKLNINKKEYENSTYLIELIEELNNLSNLQYEKLEKLEFLYEKYKYQLILSREKNDNLITMLNELTRLFNDFDKSKIKIVNLLHNAGISDSNVIKIKHDKKMELIKVLKICTSDYSSVLDLIELNGNIHDRTINKLQEKIKEIDEIANKLSNEFIELNQIKNNK